MKSHSGTLVDVVSPGATPGETVFDLDDLRREVGSALVTDPSLLEGYRRDESELTAAGTPLGVVRARSISDVQATLRWANQRQVPVVTRGAGSGLAGGANAIDGCIVLSLSGLNRIVHIDASSRLATVEAGVINGDLARAVAEVGLWYPPDPGSRDFSTIGGNVATNAGGSCCVKYGVTADHVARIKAILPDGRMIHTGARTRKNVAGLNIGQLLVGSEGTLAVIVEVTVRLRPAPTAMATVVASFAETSDAIEAVLEMSATVEPCVVELMDRTTARAVEEMTRMGLDTEAGALLLIQCDGPEEQTQAARCAAICRRTAIETWSTTEPDEGEAMMAARRSAFTALQRLGTVLLDDVAVPVPQLPGMLRFIESIADRHRVRIGTFGHAGDGNLHPTVIFDAENPEEVLRARAAFEEIVERAVALGGTITGEHGVGTLKREYLRQMLGGTELELAEGIRDLFDPKRILNPGRG